MSPRNLIAAALGAALLSTPAGAGDVTDPDRFQLWSECQPVSLTVEDLSEDAAEIGLTKEAIEVAVRSRLRGARIYGDGDKGIGNLYVRVSVNGKAASLEVRFQKVVIDALRLIRRFPSKAINLRDEFSELENAHITNLAATWETGAIGTHGNDSGFILNAVGQHTDQFIDEYLRVNAEAC